MIHFMDGADTVVPADYAELARLAWNRDASRPITGEEALGLYELNWRVWTSPRFLRTNMH
jgi:hypothetical protein